MDISRLIAASVLLSVLLPAHSDSTSWSYGKPNGPDTWGKQFPTCNGTQQSPINILPKATTFNAGLEDLTIQYEATISAELENNGHSVQASFTTGRSNISGGGLPNAFRAVQMHFHWGSIDSRGSEHQMAGKTFPMEIHIVHYNAEKYANLTTAMEKDDGLAVLGVFVEIHDQDNPSWNSIVNNLNKTLYKGEKTIIQSLQAMQFLPKASTRYYTYRGSLTTPACFESVHWIVFDKSVYISKTQLDTYRKLFEADRQSTKKTHLVDNFRPVQPSNKRKITRSFQTPNFPCTIISKSTMVCSKNASGNNVFYNVTVNMCTLPVTVTLEVSEPVIGYNYVEILHQDIKQPTKIGNLDYGFLLEMHSHYRATEQGYLHITVKQVHPLSTRYPTEVISGNFDNEDCQLAKCTSRGCNKHWCDGTTIGYGNDTLNLGFSSVMNYASSKLPTVVVNFYRSGGKSWYLSAKKTFHANETKEVVLTRTIVGGTGSPARKRRAAEASQWSRVTFQALISKSSKKIVFQLLMVYPSNGLLYTVINDTYPMSSECIKPNHKGLSDGGKIAIGLTVMLLVVVLVGVTIGILYCKRRKYFSHRAALVQEMDTHDDYITDNTL